MKKIGLCTQVYTFIPPKSVHFYTAVDRTKHPALHRYFVRLKRRTGYLKTIVALAHKVLRLLWHSRSTRDSTKKSHRPEKVKDKFFADKNLPRRERGVSALLTQTNYMNTKPKNDIKFKGWQGG
jgi:S-adenosylmethionine:diacylglycerol 3-amino-3-carboxypropyl transferase